MLCLGCHSLIGQTFHLAGDTDGFFIFKTERTFQPNASLSIDMDCDGIEDVALVSYKGAAPGSPWDRLSIRLAEQVTLHNSGMGRITPFIAGDTIWFRDDDWTSALDFIYGTGVAGPYGHPQLENVYLAFRKTGQDRHQCYLRFSSSGITFQVHEIHIQCPDDPVLDARDPLAPFIYPNPCLDRITAAPGPWDSVEILDQNGRMWRTAQATGTVSTTDLPPGLYFLRARNTTNNVHIWKFIKG